MPPNPDLSYIGLEEFTSEPAVEILNAKTCKDVPKVVKNDNGAPIIKDWKSDSEDEDDSRAKIEKKTINPSVAKVEFVKHKQQSQNARKTVKNGVIDSGCSRHITGNKSFLIDYEEIDGGFVAFG
nr:copia protein [Tanacetum cinerariifolium]